MVNRCVGDPLIRCDVDDLRKFCDFFGDLINCCDGVGDPMNFNDVAMT